MKGVKTVENGTKNPSFLTKVFFKNLMICHFCDFFWPFDFVISEKSQSELIFTFAICLIWDTNHGFLGVSESLLMR